jgi:aminotransferase
MKEKLLTPTCFSERTAGLRQSSIRSASVRCNAINGINLGQGVCDIPTHDAIKLAATDAIYANKNLYAPHEGLFELRTALAKKIQTLNHVTADPMREILITHGSTGAYVSAIKTLFNPGDEVILLEPFYGYHKYILELLGMKIVTAKISLENYAIDFINLRRVITDKTRGLILCTPCNPSGKVFKKEELIQLGELAKQNDLFIITDEIYEYITYPGQEHVSLASLEDYWNRTVTISGFSKTYNVTGWRLGYAYAPENIIAKMALVHDLLYICPPTPLQHAMIAALALDNDYIVTMQQAFLNKRNYMVSALRELKFDVQEPEGAYYLMADFSRLNFKDDETAAALLLEHAKVATVPGRSFYQNPNDGRSQLRFCFALEENKLKLAVDNMRTFLESANLL